MDPDVTLAQMCATTDDDERRELGLALERWLVMGGFPPAGYSVSDARAMCRAAITGR